MPNRTTGELEVLLDDLKTAISDKVQSAKEQLTDSINRVESQTIKTNGRVTALEKWMWICIGGGSIIVMLVIPLIVYVWNTAQSIDSRVHNAVQQSLNEFNK